MSLRRTDAESDDYTLAFPGTFQYFLTDFIHSFIHPIFFKKTSFNYGYIGLFASDRTTASVVGTLLRKNLLSRRETF